MGAESDKFPAITVVPETPRDSMEFLSRSWSVSAAEISRALLPVSRKRNFVVDRLPELIVPESIVFAAATGDGHAKRSWSGRHSIIPHHATLGKWFHFHHKELSKTKSKHKERERAERAQVHAAVSVAGLAAAVAAIAAGNYSNDKGSKMNEAMASATELLASHCIEFAEQVDDHEHVATAIQSAVDVRSAGDLMTLTAAAATALRGAAALKQRLQKDINNHAAVIPYEKGQNGSPDIWCKEGELLKRTSKGTLHKKQVSLYINKKSQVIAKLKSKHLGGALSKKKKSVVYAVFEDIPEWPWRENGMEERSYFGLRTAQGLIEFECENQINKQKWVAGVQNLLKQASGVAEEIEHPMELLKIR